MGAIWQAVRDGAATALLLGVVISLAQQVLARVYGEKLE